MKGARQIASVARNLSESVLVLRTGSVKGHRRRLKLDGHSSIRMSGMSYSPALLVRSVAQLFKALGDDTRLRIVALLCHGELCVCHLQD